MIPLKSDKDLEMMRCAGRILAAIMHELQKHICVNISTFELDRIAGELFFKERVIAAFKGYKGFPANICASVNEEIVHGIPDKRKLKEGDILSLDLGLNYQGFFSDAAITVGIGKISSQVEKLIEVTKAALGQGIEQARENNHLLDISYAIQSYVESKGFSVVKQFVGHGIGKELHEEPEIPNFGQPHQGKVLKKGMVFAIEPMVNIGTWKCEIIDNGWTAVTCDKSYSAHFENTVAITKDGPEILTKLS
ncbi:MAG: type I methionyl aminopeptidase [Candidatus Omnitrophota bacterium]